VLDLFNKRRSEENFEGEKESIVDPIVGELK
jgi:hypothetical protein